jgi:hypothetical protein
MAAYNAAASNNTVYDAPFPEGPTRDLDDHGSLRVNAQPVWTFPEDIVRSRLRPGFRAVAAPAQLRSPSGFAYLDAFG